MPIGTLVNTLAVLAGSLIGLLLQRKFPDNIRTICFQGLGLCTLLIGVQMALQVANILILIFSVLIGVSPERVCGCTINYYGWAIGFSGRCASAVSASPRGW